MTDPELLQRCADRLGLHYFAQSWTGGIFHYVGAAGAADVRDFNPLQNPEQARELDPEGKCGDMRFAAARKAAVMGVLG